MANLYDIMDAYGESVNYDFDVYNYQNSTVGIENIIDSCDEFNICNAKDNVNEIIQQCERESTWSRSIKINYNNKTYTLLEWSEILGIKYDTLYCRYKRKWSVEKIITTPVNCK